MGKIKSSVEEEPNDAFTSMIDIVFLLLIFFILQPFKEPERKLAANLPTQGAENNNLTDTPRDPIRISISAVGQNNALFMVNGRQVGYASNLPVTNTRLAGFLIQQRGGNTKIHKETPVSIRASQNVAFKHILFALDQCNSAEMGNIQFAF